VEHGGLVGGEALTDEVSENDAFANDRERRPVRGPGDQTGRLRSVRPLDATLAAECEEDAGDDAVAEVEREGRDGVVVRRSAERRGVWSDRRSSTPPSQLTRGSEPTSGMADDIGRPAAFPRTLSEPNRLGVAFQSVYANVSERKIYIE
jgi:hypothetical protein